MKGRGGVTVWLARHGETPWNVAGRYTGWADLPLTARGRAQAEALAERLAGVRFDGSWSSDLARAVETARIVGSPPRVDPRLRELDFGDLEGLTWEEVHPRVRARMGDPAFVSPGGEAVAQLRRRVLAFLDGLPPGDHLVVSHGGVARVLARECGSDRLLGNGELLVVGWEGRRVKDAWP